MAGHYAFRVFSLLIGLLRILFILLVVRLVGRFVVAVMQGYLGTPKAHPTAGPRAATEVDLVRDRVCNTFVDRKRAVTRTVNGETAYFCSAACRDHIAVPALSR